MPETVKKTTTPAKPRKTAAKKSSAANVQTMPSVPTHNEVAELARRYWAERGYQDGHSEEDWFRAEQELRAKAS